MICKAIQSNTHLRFPTRFDNGDDNIRSSIVGFAADKLLGPSGNIARLDPDESLACLAVRLGLDFKATAWFEKVAEHTQVEHHMRLYLDATEDFRTTTTIPPSEPLLAEASRMIMGTSLGKRKAPEALLMHINESHISAGDRGELIAALLLTLTRDSATRNRKTPIHHGQLPEGVPLTKYDGTIEGRIVTVLEFAEALVPSEHHYVVRTLMPALCSQGHFAAIDLARAFGDAYIYFNHFIKVYDFQMVSRKYLWRIICRGAAVICANNQHGVDIIIPVIMGTILQPRFVTAIFVQVKNDGRRTDSVDSSFFTVMDPFKIGLFSEDDAKDAAAVPPVLRIVLALPSEKSSVGAPDPPIPGGSPAAETPVGKFTAYDIWIAGVSEKSFGVIPDTSVRNQYKPLFDRTRNVFSGYGAPDRNGPGEVEKMRIECRRMMHAAAAPGYQHFQNYICNLAEAPVAHKDGDVRNVNVLGGKQSRKKEGRGRRQRG